MSESMFPSTWSVKKLSEIAKVIDPQPDHRAPVEVEHGYPYVGVGDFNPDGTIDFKKTRKVSLDAVNKQEASFTINTGDIVFGKVGTIGNPRYLNYDRKYALSATMVLIKPLGVLNQYLYFILQSEIIDRQIKKLTTGSTRPTVGILKIRELELPVPDFPEQQKIANILTSVDKAIKKTEAIIAQTETVKKGLIQQLLTKGIGHTRFKQTEIGEIPEGWEIVNYKEIFIDIKSGISRMFVNEDVGYPVVRSSNIKNNNLDLEELKYWYLQDKQGVNLTNFVLEDGDLLINFINSLSQIGKVCLFSKQRREFIYTTNIFRAKVNRQYILNNYFYYYAQTSVYRKDITSIVKQAINQASFTKGDFEKLILPLPNLKEQQKIVSILFSIDQKISIEQQKLTQLQTLKKGLMQVLLTGKVRVKVDEPEEVVQ